MSALEENTKKFLAPLSTAWCQTKEYRLGQSESGIGARPMRILELDGGECLAYFKK